MSSREKAEHQSWHPDAECERGAAECRPQHHAGDHDRQCYPIDQVSGGDQQRGTEQGGSGIGQSESPVRDPKVARHSPPNGDSTKDSPTAEKATRTKPTLRERQWRSRGRKMGLQGRRIEKDAASSLGRGRRLELWSVPMQARHRGQRTGFFLTALQRQMPWLREKVERERGTLGAALSGLGSLVQLELNVPGWRTFIGPLGRWAGLVD